MGRGEGAYIWGAYKQNKKVVPELREKTAAEKRIKANILLRLELLPYY